MDDRLDPSRYTVVRVDGVGFHTYTQLFLRPYDPFLHACLDRAIISTLRRFPFWIGVYAQSDEISVIFQPIRPPLELAYSGRLEKWQSILPSLLSSNFHLELRKMIGHIHQDRFTSPFADVLKMINQWHVAKRLPSVFIEWDIYVRQLITASETEVGFDCKIWQYSTQEDVKLYLTQRRMDAIRNAHNSLVHFFYGKEALDGIKTQSLLDRAEQEYRLDLHSLPTFFQRGIYYRRETDHVVDDFHADDDLTTQLKTHIIPK